MVDDADNMIPLYQDPCFTFRFAEDRIISRFHLEGVEYGRQVSVFKIDPATGERLRLLITATVGESGWVDLPEPIFVGAGEAFIAVPGAARSIYTPGKTLLIALGAGGLLALVGYLLGLARGDDEFVLALACGLIGGLVVLLGYGPIAFVIAAIGGVAVWFRKKKDG